MDSKDLNEISSSKTFKFRKFESKDKAYKSAQNAIDTIITHLQTSYEKSVQLEQELKKRIENKKKSNKNFETGIQSNNSLSDVKLKDLDLNVKSSLHYNYKNSFNGGIEEMDSDTSMSVEDEEDDKDEEDDEDEEDELTASELMRNVLPN